MAYEAIVALAQLGEKDEFTTELDLGDELNQALAQAMQEERQQQLQAAVKEIIQIRQQAEEIKKRHIETIRVSRINEKRAKECLDNIKHALEYAAETKNYLPLLTILGKVSPAHHASSADVQKFFVPEDWQPKVTEKTETKPAAKKTSKK